MDEVLVVLAPFGPWTARDLAAQQPLRSGGPQVFGDRVLIARLDPDDCSELAARDAVAGVFRADVPEELVASDDAVGQIAIRAWNARHGSAAAPKERIGEGAAWDDPGFEREG